MTWRDAAAAAAPLKREIEQAAESGGFAADVRRTVDEGLKQADKTPTAAFASAPYEKEFQSILWARNPRAAAAGIKRRVGEDETGLATGRVSERRREREFPDLTQALLEQGSMTAGRLPAPERNRADIGRNVRPAARLARSGNLPREAEVHLLAGLLAAGQGRGA